MLCSLKNGNGNVSAGQEATQQRRAARGRITCTIPYTQTNSHPTAQQAAHKNREHKKRQKARAKQNKLAGLEGIVRGG